MNARTLSQPVALALITTIFFMWGFITCLNDVLIPHLKALFTLSYFQAMLVQFTFFGAYFIMALPSGRVLVRLGHRGSIALGLAITGIGALLFIPAARLVSYEFFLGALFVLASGITLLQVAANPYVSLLGDPRHASSRLNLAQALNSLGTTLAPQFGGLLILSAAVLGTTELAALTPEQLAAYHADQAGSVIVPYLAIAAVLFALAILIFLMRLPLVPGDAHEAADWNNLRAVLRVPHVRLGVVAIFVYVGAEVAIGSLLINYLAAPEIGNISEKEATTYVSLYWGGAMVGRFIGSALLRTIDPGRLLGFAALGSVLLLGVTMATRGQLAVASVVAVGLCNAIMFPTIFTLAIARLGALTDHASSLLIMAIVGGALIPPLQGAVADRFGLQPSFLVPLVCYVFIVYYGWRGARVVEGTVPEPAGAVAAVPARH